MLARLIVPNLAEICVVDSSDETPARGEIEELCRDAGIELGYVHPAPRGLTIQRNIGIDRTHGDPVFLIDDDVLLDAGTGVGDLSLESLAKIDHIFVSHRRALAQVEPALYDRVVPSACVGGGVFVSAIEQRFGR